MILTEVPIGLDVGIKNVRIDRFVKQAIPSLDAIAQRGPEFCKLVSRPTCAQYHIVSLMDRANRYTSFLSICSRSLKP